MLYYSIQSHTARLNKLIGHKSYIVCGDCFNRVFDCYINWQKVGPATLEFGYATAWYTRVSAITESFKPHFYPINNLCLQALMTSL